MYRQRALRFIKTDNKAVDEAKKPLVNYPIFNDPFYPLQWYLVGYVYEPFIFEYFIYLVCFIIADSTERITATDDII